MEKRAFSKFVRISAFKAREVARLIQGKSVAEALAIVNYCPRKAAMLIGKTLQSAIANAKDARMSVNDLFVKRAIVGEGPTMKRIQYKSRGRAGRIRKRSSHIEIIVSDEK